MGHSDKRFKQRSSAMTPIIIGSISGTVSTAFYQPLELLKTRIQIDHMTSSARPTNFNQIKILGRATRSAILLSRQQGIKYLWKGTGASMLRVGPGAGLYYALLNAMQSNFSDRENQPDNPTQAFYFGLTARSLVTFILLPITVVKVRYESGIFYYQSLSKAVKSAYLSNGWVGIAPTILRDSLFSATYYMCYTKLKNDNNINDELAKNQLDPRIFMYGVVSGLIASVITNPIDVLKTNIQVAEERGLSMRFVAAKLLSEPAGYLRFLDGLVLRSLRRTLLVASTWTMYEFLAINVKKAS